MHNVVNKNAHCLLLLLAHIANINISIKRYSTNYFHKATCCLHYRQRRSIQISWIMRNVIAFLDNFPKQTNPCEIKSLQSFHLHFTYFYASIWLAYLCASNLASAAYHRRRKPSELSNQYVISSLQALTRQSVGLNTFRGL